MKMYVFLAAIIIFLTLFSTRIYAVPSPHNIEGKVYTNSSNGVQNGIPVMINNTVSGKKVITYVDAPPAAIHRGSYSATIDGEDYDTIVLTAWNNTHFGNNTAILDPKTTTVDIKLNYTRPPEANVTIIKPSNDTLKNKTISFNVTANITILGSSGIGCSATINFSDNNVLNLSAGESFVKDLGDVEYMGYKVVNWSIKGINEGSANITVSSRCSNSGRSFENLYTKYVNNVTIQNIEPSVSDIRIDDPIDLEAGGNLTVYCNATITDYNTVEDIKKVNATFFLESYGPYSDDMNYHYTNSSCTNFSSTMYEANYSCSFSVAYFAYNGTWMCNITTSDYSNATDHDNLTTLVNELLAIDISPTVIDYGTMKATNISAEDVNITIRNFGNIDFNISIRGYAPNETYGYLNNSMTCEYGNISNAYQRYSIYYDTDYTDMYRMNNETNHVRNITFNQREDDAGYGSDVNKTYWKIEVPSLTSGMCNGTVIFGAIPAD